MRKINVLEFISRDGVVQAQPLTKTHTSQVLKRQQIQAN